MQLTYRETPNLAVCPPTDDVVEGSAAAFAWGVSLEQDNTK